MNPIAKKPLLRENERMQTIIKPGKETYRETYVQPLIQKENV